MAETLLLQGEMRERQRYLKKANLFAHDIQEDHNMHDRDNFIENIVPEMDV